MQITNEQKQQQWQERTKHYPYNVLVEIYGNEINAPFNATFDYASFEQNLASEIESQISALPQGLQYVFMLYVEDDLSYEQIASREELPKEVVLDRIALTLRHLRRPKNARKWQKYLDEIENNVADSDTNN